MNLDDFTRQDRIALFTQSEKIIALHAYTFFDLKFLATEDHSYFRSFYPDHVLKELKRQNVSRVMTMELFSVERDWRAPRLGISLAAVLAGLGLKLAHSLGADAVLSVIRSDIGVDKLAREFGAVSLESDLLIYNTPCELMVFHAAQIRPHGA